MEVLVLGGTQFVGRHIVEALVAAGHRVSILTRGVSPDALPPEVERLRGDRDAGPAGLGALAGRAWDACIDVSGYTPRQVRASAELLRDGVKQYLYVSAVSVYGDPDERPVQETNPLLPPAAEDVTDVNGETYGPLKVACERIVQEVYAGRCTILRPQVVVGPLDPSGRYTYWVQRAMQGGEMLAPGDGSDHLQVIDVRDVAAFVRQAAEQRVTGIFNLAGPRITWAAFMELLGASVPVWVPAPILLAAGLTFLELPLYRPERGARASLMDVSSDLARAAGLTLTAPEVTLRDTRAWVQGRMLTAGLPPEREAALIRLAREQ